MDSVVREALPGRGVRVVVAGGAGFLGSHLCAALLQRGCSVVAIDNLATGDMRNLAALFSHRNFRFARHDIVARATIKADWIFNLACCASPRHYLGDPVHTLRTCTDGVLNLLQEAQACRARIFQASTSEVYGEPEQHPQCESYRGSVNPDGPRACHDEGKRCAEAIFFDFHRNHGVEIKVARIFNTYGPHMQVDDGRVVANLIVHALRNQPLTLNADGGQTRSFCYVDDMVEGMVRLMEAPAHVTGPINLGSPVEISVAELARQIIALTGSRSPIVHRPAPVDESRRRCPDISMARRELDWAPKVALETGLVRTIAWFDRVLRDGRKSQSEPSHAVA